MTAIPRVEMRGTSIANVAARYASDLIGSGQVDVAMFGPVVVNAEDRPYFVVVTGRLNAHGESTGMFAASLGAAAALRMAMIDALLRRRGLVIQMFDDELAMARMAARLWPVPFASTVARIEVERAGGGTA